MNKGLTMKTGQTHMQRNMKPLFQKIQAGEIDGCIKVGLKP
jgi:hypothetical protein